MNVVFTRALHASDGVDRIDRETELPSIPEAGTRVLFRVPPGEPHHREEASPAWGVIVAVTLDLSVTPARAIASLAAHFSSRTLADLRADYGSVGWDVGA